MRPPGFIPAAFSFTPRAVAMIEQMRRDVESRDQQSIGAVGFAWGHVRLNDGTTLERPMIGFYMQSQMDEVAHASVQYVNGVDLIVFSTRDQAKNFDGRIIDFSVENGFFVAGA